MAPALYGVLIGIAFFVLTKIVPQPAGAIIFWGFFSIQLSWGALTCWRRTGLPFATAALVAGAVMSMCLVVPAVMGQPFQNLAPQAWVLFAGGALLGPAFLLIESRVNHDKWQEWRRRCLRTAS